MSKAITRQQFEALEEKLPLRGGVICCSQGESENAIEQLIREAKKQLSAAPDHRTKDWMHVASNLQSLTESWKGSLNMWLSKGMLTGGPRDSDIFLELHGAVRNLRNSLAQKKDELKLRKGGKNSGKTRQRASAIKKAICQMYWDSHKSEYKVRKTAYYHLENAWPDLTFDYDFELDFPTYGTFCKYLREK